MLLLPLYFLTEKGKINSVKFTGTQIGKQAAAKSKGLFSADDWMCSKYVLMKLKLVRGAEF